MSQTTTEYSLRILLPETFSFNLFDPGFNRRIPVLPRTDRDLGAIDIQLTERPPVCGTLYECVECPVLNHIRSKELTDTSGPVRTIEQQVRSTLPPSKSTWMPAAYDVVYHRPFHTVFSDLGLESLDSFPGLDLARGISNQRNTVYSLALCRASQFLGVQQTGYRIL